MSLRDRYMSSWQRYMRRWYPVGKHTTPMLPGLIRYIVIVAAIVVVLCLASCSFLMMIFRGLP